ncbi:unnamed protein product [Phytophthora fragariaefolia]|uniref:RxLR effector protein n=1 Tax=Phytophthora fragariaefolia TaxID=1490495 RepID=A0A9W6YP59_9STRA|nr:unnamed protein product [Phytophthora fragariaefolia]
MRLSHFVLIAAITLLVDQDCDAASQAAKVSTLETNETPVNVVSNNGNTDRLLRSHDSDYDSIEREERVSINGLLSLMKLKRNVDKGPIDVSNLPIVTKLTKKDFSKAYIAAMKQDPAFKRKMFKKWDVYEDMPIEEKMKKLFDKQLALEYMNRRSRGMADGTIVTGKANINVAV